MVQLSKNCVPYLAKSVLNLKSTLTLANNSRGKVILDFIIIILLNLITKYKVKLYLTPIGVSQTKLIE